MLDDTRLSLTAHEAWIAEIVQNGYTGTDRLTAIYDDITSNPIVYVEAAQAFALPFVITQNTWAEWAQASEQIVDLVWRVVNRNVAEHGQDFLGSLGLDAQLVAALSRTPKPSGPQELIARPDFMLGPKGPVFLETNIDSSLGGLGTAGALADVYRNHGLTSGLRRCDPGPALAAQFRRLAERPDGRMRIAICDWQDEIDDVPWPYERKANDLAAFGIDTVITGPQAFQWSPDTGLSVDGLHVDAVYRGVTPVTRLWQDLGAFDAIWQASHRIPVLTSLWSVAFSSKAVLAWLWRHVHDGTLDTNDAAFVRRHVPWTALANAKRATGPDGRENIDLAAYLIAHQADLVLKSPSDGSCKNVTVGRYTSPTAWQAAVETACGTPGYVVQSYVAPAKATNAGAVDQAQGMTEYYCNFSVFVFGGHASGTCIRGTGKDGPFISCMHGAREGVAMILQDPLPEDRPCPT